MICSHRKFRNVYNGDDDSYFFRRSFAVVSFAELLGKMSVVNKIMHELLLNRVINLYFEKIHLKELGNNLRLSLMYSV